MGTKRTRHALVSHGRNSRVAEHELYTSNIVNQNIWSDPFEIEDTPPVRFNEPNGDNDHHREKQPHEDPWKERNLRCFSGNRGKRGFTPPRRLITPAPITTSTAAVTATVAAGAAVT